MRNVNLLPTVLIGPVSDDPAESVSAVNQAFIAGLAASYRFRVQRGDRRFGMTRQSSLNWVNGTYFASHLAAWIWHITFHRPALAHYAVNSGWAMEKSLVFLRIARLFKVRTLGHLHSGSFLEFWKGLPEQRRSRALRELQSLDALIVLSEGWRKAIRETVGLPDERLLVVNNPISWEFEQRAVEMPVESRVPSVLSVGIMGRDKGVFDLLAAVKTATEQVAFRVQLAGPEREPGVREAALRFIDLNELQNVVSLPGPIWGDEKLRLFADSSIFLLPSYYENFPLVLLEAAAAGMAIIATPVGAVPEFLEHNVSAILVEPGNVPQIADALVQLGQHPEERERLGRAARQRFQSKFCRSRIMDSLDRVYQTILARSR